MQSEPNRLLCVMRMLRANGGIFEGRKRLHKSAYLLDAFGAEGFSAIRFDFGSSGPFSREISDALHELVVRDLIAEAVRATNAETREFLYKMTTTGDEWLRSMQSEEGKDLQRALKFLGELPYDALEFASTILFLENESQSTDRHHGHEIALRRNPTFALYEAEAQQVLHRVKTPKKRTKSTKTQRLIAVPA